MCMRNRTRCLIVATVLLVGTAACGDKTVTSQPAVTTAPAGETPGTGSAVDTTAADDSDLQVVEQLLRDVDGDITATDQDRATPEGDPAQ